MPVRRVRQVATALVTVAVLATAGQAATGQLVVRRGDNLSSLARRHGVSVRSLAGANGIADANRIREGQVLQLSGATAVPAAQPGRYKVQPGDSLERIARRHGVSVAALADANRLANRHRIIAGSWLTVPGGAAAASAPTASGGATHVVRAGDVLGSIARRHGVTAAALASANGITNPNRIRIGARLTIPGPSANRGGAGLPARLRADPARMALLPHFDRWAAANGLPPDLLKAMAWMESGFQNGARSWTGAMGVGQLMPATVEFVSQRLIGVRLDPWNPHDNIRMSARYLRWLLDRTGGSSNRALAAYYQGLRSLRERGTFPSTVTYVRSIQELRSRF